MSGTLPVKPPWKTKRKNPPFLKFSYPFSPTPTITHPPPATPIKSPAFHPFGPRSQGPKVPRHMECLSLNGWRVCQQKVHHNPWSKRRIGFDQAGFFNRWCSESQRDHKVETPQPSLIISFRPTKAQVSGNKCEKHFTSTIYLCCFGGVGCVLFWGYQWKPICISKH